MTKWGERRTWNGRSVCVCGQASSLEVVHRLRRELTYLCPAAALLASLSRHWLVLSTNLCAHLSSIAFSHCLPSSSVIHYDWSRTAHIFESLKFLIITSTTTSQILTTTTMPRDTIEYDQAVLDKSTEIHIRAVRRGQEGEKFFGSMTPDNSSLSQPSNCLCACRLTRLDNGKGREQGTASQTLLSSLPTCSL